MNMPLSCAGVFGLGLLASIDPCALPADLAAIAFFSRRLARPADVLKAGLLYALGRMAVYCAIGLLIIRGIALLPGLQAAFASVITKLMGPVLILLGALMLLRTRHVHSHSCSCCAPAHDYGGNPFAMGILFALSFCPHSAELFFGVIIPFAAGRNSAFFVPALYGFGTALLPIALAAAIAFGVKGAGATAAKLDAWRPLLQKTTAALFIAAGIYLIFENLG